MSPALVAAPVSTRTRGWSNSTGRPSTTSTAATRPATSETMGFISFIASTMPSVWPTSTISPMATNAGAPGEGAA